MKAVKVKQLKCSICKESFDAFKLFTVDLKRYCSPECGAVLALQLKQKKDKARLKEERKILKQKKENLNDRYAKKEWMEKVKTICHKFTRIRDASDPCISCGITNEELMQEEWRPGGYWDAGHYKSRGARPELRFEPLNIHKQCKTCNGGKFRVKRDETVTQEYRKRLIKKIGLENVEWLEGPHAEKKYTIDDLKLLHTHFKRLIKQLEG